MRKTLFILSLCLSLFAHGQDGLNFVLDAPTQAQAGEPFQIAFTLNATEAGGINASNFKAPTFRGLDILQGPMQSNSSNTSFINGRRSQTISLSLIYVVVARKAGMINFGPASIEVEGKTYKTSGASIQVVKSSPQRNNPSPNAPGNRRPSNPNATPPPPASLNDDDLYIQAVPSKSRPYEGEEVVINYKIFTSVPVSSYSIYKIPANTGFWVEDLSNRHVQPQSKTQQIRGKSFVTADIRRIAAYPQTSGKLSIDPMEVEVIAQVRSARRSTDPFEDFFNDPFSSFFGGVQNVKKVIHTSPTVFEVRPLPKQGRPESFNGNVGNFQFKSSINRKELKANEALNITLTISGEGNLRHIEAPQFNFPADFEVYEPSVSENIELTEQGMRGSKTFEYVVIPRTQGVYTIPVLEFSFFDPKKERYVEHRTDEHTIKVNVGDITTTKASPKNPNNPYANRDIEFIHTEKHRLHSIDRQFAFSPWFWGLSLVPLFLFAVFVAIWQRIQLRNKDTVGLMNRRAFAIARKNLKRAEKFKKENRKDEFYVEISQALWGFLSKKFNIPVAQLSIESVHQALAGKDIEASYIDLFIKALENCEFARFAPNGQSLQSMQEVYDEAFQVISQIIRALEK